MDIPVKQYKLQTYEFITEKNTKEGGNIAQLVRYGKRSKHFNVLVVKIH